MSLWGSPWFFGRVHFIPIHYSHFLFTLVFIFLTLVNSTEEGHICRPPGWLEREEKNIIFFRGVGEIGSDGEDGKQREI